MDPLVSSLATSQGDVATLLASVFAIFVGKPLLSFLYQNPKIKTVNRDTIHTVGLVIGAIAAVVIQYATGTLELGHIEGLFKALINAWGISAGMTHVHEVSKTPVDPPQDPS